MGAADCLRNLSLHDMLSKVVPATSAHPEFLESLANTTTETSRAIVSHAMFEATLSVAPGDTQSFQRHLCELLRQGLANSCRPAVPLYGLTINARSNGDSLMLVASECSFDFSSDSATASLEALFIKQQDGSVRVVVLATTWEPRAAK
jgi:hypothetical protein